MTDRATVADHSGDPKASLSGLLRRWKRRSVVCLNLALQGGGAHGAFTWGVLDALLGRPGLAFEGVSGSSAGAMNAVVMADGWMKGGPEGARQALAHFWAEVANQGKRVANPY